MMASIDSTSEGFAFMICIGDELVVAIAEMRAQTKNFFADRE
jgi:hypothetical protein